MEVQFKRETASPFRMAQEFDRPKGWEFLKSPLCDFTGCFSRSRAMYADAEGRGICLCTAHETAVQEAGLVTELAAK